LSHIEKQNNIEQSQSPAKIGCDYWWKPVDSTVPLMVTFYSSSNFDQPILGNALPCWYPVIVVSSGSGWYGQLVVLVGSKLSLVLKYIL